MHLQENNIVVEKLKKCLIEAQVEDNKIESILNSFKDFDPFYKVNKILDTNYKRKKIYFSRESYIKPIKILIGKDEDESFNVFSPSFKISLIIGKTFLI